MSSETADIPTEPLSLDTLEEALAHDTKVKVAGIDVDGILRGKLISKKKFLSIAKDGFGFCSVIFGWDMHDQTYFRELKISSAENGYRDMVAIPDLQSFRRIPWENDVPFFLVSFHNPDGEGQPVCACPRGLLKTVMSSVEDAGYSAMAGGENSRNVRTCERIERTDGVLHIAEYEFYQFRAPLDPSSTTRNSSSTAAFLNDNPPSSLPSLTEGMFGYSLTRPVHNQEYYYDIFHTCEKFKCNIEGWHTESGPGVYEAVGQQCIDTLWS